MNIATHAVRMTKSPLAAAEPARSAVSVRDAWEPLFEILNGAPARDGRGGHRPTVTRHSR
ncbi:hypothetical protein ACWT_4681 [Actinoplanes sp. SE50]|nr:hypothetical protein ACPL_4812 [Actinoplanes sp. SE50/110]ATO84096.1 hypothetical protein ACWT_4681 [Actinoplanes sp. SE50]SLM01506.1 hypothetical protein ACSP50_4742 [Actinoplanes sp. SE50/110]